MRRVKKFVATSRVRVRALLAAALAVGVLPGLAAAPADAASVNVYSSRHYEADQTLYARFTEETGIEVKVVKADAGQLIERLKSEGANSPADILFTADVGNLARAQEDGLFQAVRSSVLETHVPATLRHPDGYWFALTKRARVIMYAKDRVAPDAVARYADLADPKWKGRVVIRSSSNVYNQSLVASMIAHDGAERTEAWARGLVANMARPPKGGDRDQIRAVAAGLADLAVSNTYYLAQMVNASQESDREAAAKIGVIFPDQDGRGAHVNISGAGVTRHAPNRDNAVKLLEFLVGAAAQKVLAEANYEYPVRDGVATAATVLDFGAFKADDLALARVGALNGEAVKVMDRAGWR